MLKNLDSFKDLLKNNGMSITAPSVQQVLSEDELIKILPEHDGWIIGDDPANKKVLTAGKKGKLKAAVKWGVGIDNVDFEAAKKLGIKIDHTPGMFNEEVADLALGYILGLARESFLIDRKIRKGIWYKPTGISLRGKKVALIGYGNIGKALAVRLNVLGLQLYIYDPYVAEISNINYSFFKFPEKLNEVDFIAITCALTEKNKGMFNKNIFDQLKNGVRMVNVSRGGLINEKDLVEALENERIHSVALDVFEEEPLKRQHPIMNFEKNILGSHNASNTIEAVKRTSEKAINLISELLT